MKFLTKAQKISLALLAASPLREKFYWTGGTLLAYHYLNHRKSLDLDFFSSKQFSFEEINHFVNKVKRKIGFKGLTYQKIYDRWEFLFKNKDFLRIEFVYYNREKKTLRTREKFLGVYIDSLEDIAANKVMAYFDRNEPKDLFDIYFLIKKAKFTPKKLLVLTRQKFGVNFDESLFWSESFKGMKLLTGVKPLMIEKSSDDKNKLLTEIEEYFKEKSRKYLQQYFK